MKQFEDNLKKAKTTSELYVLLKTELSSLGIKTFSFTYYSYHLNSLNKLKYDCASENFIRWHKHYQEQNFEEIDSTLDKVSRTNFPVFWDLQKQLQEAKTPKEKQMRLDSIEFGAEKGLSIPIHGPDGDFANFLVVQMKGENCLEDWQHLQYKLFLVGYYYFSYLQLLILKTEKPNIKFKLNKRTVQCLNLIAQRYSVTDIAKKLNITERTVNYHIQKLNKQLGTKNKYQSVIKALEHGLIT